MIPPGPTIRDDGSPYVRPQTELTPEGAMRSL